MKKKLLAVLFPMIAMAMVGCGDKPEDKAPDYQKDKTYHWVLNEAGEVDKESKVKHTFEEDTSKAIAATCKTEGKKVDKCTVCGYEKETTVNKLDHVLEADTTASKSASCSEEGKTVEKCKNCDYKKETPIAKTAHSLNAGTVKTEGGKSFIEYECSVCHQKTTNLVAFNTVEVDGDTATSGKLPGTSGVFGTWKVCLPAGRYSVSFSAKFSSSGANYPFTGSSSRGIEVKYNDESVTFDGTKTAEDYGLTTTEFNTFSFFFIDATGGIDTLAITNPYYRLVFDVDSDIVFTPANVA